jgi:N-acetylglucosamine-6-phosphate deacetylase
MGGTAGPRHDHLDPTAGGRFGELHHFLGSAVGREHPHLHAHPEALKHVHRGLHRGQVGIAAHHHRHAPSPSGRSRSRGGFSNGMGDGFAGQFRERRWPCGEDGILFARSHPEPMPVRWISNVRLPHASRCSHGSGRRWRLGVDAQGLITRVLPLEPGSCAAGDDWGGDWLSPAGVDLQINGGLGLAFPELEPADLPRLLELLDLLWADGVEAISPTLVTCGVEPLRQALAVLRQARLQHRPGRCQLLGAHLEGPFLAAARRGAHPAHHLAAPSLEALNERIKGFEAEIALVTLAPELEGAEAVIDALRQQGIVVSLGHSAATEAQAEWAFSKGVGMLTHAFNAMADLHRRAPGPVAAAVLRGDVALGLIADGVHVAPSMAVLLQRLAPEQVLLVSDARESRGADYFEQHGL